jgi:hypothetical protein
MDTNEQGKFSRSIQLLPDGSSGQLGHKPIELVDTAQRISAQDFLKWSLRAEVVHVSPGTYEDKLASIIGFRLRFRYSGSVSSGLSGAEASITFKPAPGAGRDANEAMPEVVAVFPTFVEGPAIIGHHSTSTEGSASISFPSVVQPEIGVTRRKGLEYSKDHKMKVIGRTWSDEDSETVDNMALWTLSENSLEGGGIPQDISLSALVLHNGQSVLGTVELKATCKSGIRIFGWPWTKIDPLLFSPSLNFGISPRSSKFDDIDAEDWKALVPFTGESTVNLSVVYMQDYFES